MSKKGIVYLGDKNTGKTTRLLNEFSKALLKGKTILIIDSATEHKEKSILVKIQTECKSNKVCIDACPEELITFPSITHCSYPISLILNSYVQIYLCDVSYYLEKGYDFPEGDLREKQRLLYKKLSMQIIEVMLDRVDVIIMDEIELIPESRRLIEAINDRGIELFMALHNECGLCDMSALFQIEKTGNYEERFK